MSTPNALKSSSMNLAGEKIKLKTHLNFNHLLQKNELHIDVLHTTPPL